MINAEYQHSRSLEVGAGTFSFGNTQVRGRAECGDKILKAIAAGLSAEAAAAKVGISARYLYTWQHKQPEFERAIHEGRHRPMDGAKMQDLIE